MEENCQYGIWKNRLPFHTMLCFSFIYRHLLFGVAFCGNINPTYLTNLQRVQNKAVRIITYSELRASINPCLFKSVIIKVFELYKLEIAKLMHQRHKQNLPVASQNFSNHFPLYMSIQLDQNQKINLFTETFHIVMPKSFKYYGAKIWNSFPFKVRKQLFSKFKTWVDCEWKKSSILLKIPFRLSVSKDWF